MADKQDVDIDRPLYVVGPSMRQPGSCSHLAIEVIRMDGMPELDPWGEKLRSDRENWLTLPQAMQALRNMIMQVPQYGPRLLDQEDPEIVLNLHRFNDEFSDEVAQANVVHLVRGRKIG